MSTPSYPQIGVDLSQLEFDKCICPDPTPTPTPTPTPAPTSTPTPNFCGLNLNYTCTISGGAGDFAMFNGVHTVTHTMGSTFWIKLTASYKLQLTYYAGGSRWIVIATPLPSASTCKNQLQKSTSELCDDVLGTYSTIYSCNDTTCTDTNSCSNSAMVAVIS